jgi:hypothetical protein
LRTPQFISVVGGFSFSAYPIVVLGDESIIDQEK